MAVSMSLLKQCFSFNTTNLISNLVLGKFNIYIVLFFTLILFIHSVVTEKGIDTRKKIASLPFIVRWALYIALILGLCLFQSFSTGTFIYAQF